MTVVSTIDPEEYGIVEFTESCARPLTRDELLAILAEGVDTDPEGGHWRSDMALLAYIGDPEITAAFERTDRWYA